MQQNEIKAVLATGITEFAIYPAHVEVELPFYIHGKYASCPAGLVKATLIEDGHKYIERRPVSQCGDKDFEIQRRNGVLVEISIDDVTEAKKAKRPKDSWYREADINLEIVGKKVYQKVDGKRDKNPYPHTEAFTRNGKKHMRMVVSRKAIMSTWAEYAMVEAKRQKEYERTTEARLKLRAPQAELMGLSVEELEKRHGSNRRPSSISNAFLPAEWQNLYDAKGENIIGCAGKITLSLEQAEKILSILTPAQKKRLKNG